MTKRMLINATQPEEVRVAMVENQWLYDIDIEYPGREQKKSNIYKGRITRIEPSLEAVFVDYGEERHGFLPFREIALPDEGPSESLSAESDLGSVENPEAEEATPREEMILDDVPSSEEEGVPLASAESKAELPKRKSSRGSQRRVQEYLKEGQEIIVQVEKEERGSKGAALTNFVSLAGCYLVLMPNNPKAGGVSRRIDGEERQELREALSQLQVPKEMGVIIRTAGVGRHIDELRWDLDVLLGQWQAVQNAAVLKPAPFLIHQESNVVLRAIRDHLRPEIDEILIDDLNVYEQVKEHIRLLRPDFASKVQRHTSPIPLFSHFQIENQVESAYKRSIGLPSGGTVSVDHTEALTAIDINSAKATKGSDIEETALHTNLEAANEIARQLRLRDLGGLIVIDFIDMVSIKNQRVVENALREALAMDRARVQFGRISRFGLLEMSRQRLKPTLEETTHLPCPRCEGQGKIRNVESLALSVLRSLEEEAAKSGTARLQVDLPLETATYLLNEKRHVIALLEQKYQVPIMVIPSANLHTSHYHIRRVRTEELKSRGEHRELASYQVGLQLEQAHEAEALTKKGPPRATQQPVLRPAAYTPAPVVATDAKPRGPEPRRFDAGEDMRGSAGGPRESRRVKEDFTRKRGDSLFEAPTSSNPGLIRRLWDSVFGAQQKPEMAQSVPLKERLAGTAEASQQGNNGHRRRSHHGGRYFQKRTGVAGGGGGRRRYAANGHAQAAGRRHNAPRRPSSAEEMT